ncbi:hypothetical protein O7630_10250 [Micromonospora sp. WMMD718]|uniref:hypothetical protein n=1 Tax=Micromonospora TaxID=1873 RepID=UPI00069D74A2|nr:MULTISPECIES: hypothetical protein [unclassified Micromonospora]MDG4751322.1 hypothetical protein [Micromonospora sp. WMMD718]
MSKLWWRLSEVSPLAEHAVHTPTVNNPAHLLRAPSAVAALIWEQDETGSETLRSNGSPGWHDETGQLHRAHALTWQHPASGTSGVHDHANPHRNLVLLKVRRRDRSIHPVIDTIRYGVKRKHHWFWIDTTRMPYGYGTADHREEIVPPEATWIRSEVEAPALERLSYPAVIADGYVGADGVLPRFTRDTVTGMITDLDELNSHPATMPGEFPTVAFHGDIAVISWQQHSLSDERVLEIDRCYPDAEGLYAIGAYQWTWSITRRR